MQPLTLIMTILFLAGLIKVVLGFGEALIAMPLLTLVLGIHTATPLVGLVSLTLTAFMLIQHRKKIEFRALWRLTLAAAFGIPFGLLTLKLVPVSVMTQVLGVLLVLYGIYTLMQPRWMTFADQRWGYLFGFFAGVLGSAYNTGGPPMVVYMNAQQRPPESYQAMLQGFFLPNSLLIVLSHGLSGFWSQEVLLLYVLSLPVMVAAFVAGSYASRFIPTAQFAQLVRVSLIGLGLVLLL